MKTYTKFLIITFLTSFLYVTGIMFSLVFILNLLSEIEFFKNMNVTTNFTLFLSLINSPSMIFEMFPFIFLITTQLFFIKLFQNNEIEIFKYSGLKNSTIITIIALLSFFIGILTIILFYNFSSNLKNFYLEAKSKYTSDGKYLAVITNNGLWIKDKIEEKTYIINSSEINENFLLNNFITEFDENYNVTRNLRTNKIDISEKEWSLYDVKIYNNNNYQIKKVHKIKTNFDYKRIRTLYSNLSSLNLFQLIELRENYKKLNYSLIEVNLQLLKLISFPIYLLLMTLFSALIMFRIKNFNNKTFKISVGLFFSVIIYYVNNFFFVMGSSERLSITLAILIPLTILASINSLMLKNINEK